MTIKAGNLTYEWKSNWAQLPPMEGWAHHGLAINGAGEIVSGHATQPQILILSPEGELLRSFDVPVTEVHGICVADENGDEVFWIADTGNKPNVKSRSPARVIKVDRDGSLLDELTAEDCGVGADEPFSPTAVAVDPASGNVWVTDGYGTGRIHCFSPTLERLFTLAGSRQVGLFTCPHWLFADTRKGETRIYVADRGNDRVQVFDAKGDFLHALTEGLRTPSVFGSFGEYLVIGELNARVVIVDGDDTIVGTIGDGTALLKKPGWPNRLSGEERVSPLGDIPDCQFNSPHGLCVDPQGNIYVSEWLIGDRYTKLVRCSS